MQSVIIPPYLKKEKMDREKNYHNAIINSQQNYISISAIKYQPKQLLVLFFFKIIWDTEDKTSVTVSW